MLPPRPREATHDAVHVHAVAAALGFDSVYRLLADGVAAGVELGDALYRMIAGENDADAELPATAIEAAAQRIDPAFSLASPTSEQLARWLIETECLVLVGGAGTPERLLRALRQADRIFAKPAWIGEALRAREASSSPHLVEELRALADRCAADR